MTKRSGRKWKMEPKIATVMVKRRRIDFFENPENGGKFAVECK